MEYGLSDIYTAYQVGHDLSVKLSQAMCRLYYRYQADTAGQVVRNRLTDKSW